MLVKALAKLAATCCFGSAVSVLPTCLTTKKEYTKSTFERFLHPTSLWIRNASHLSHFLCHSLRSNHTNSATSRTLLSCRQCRFQCINSTWMRTPLLLSVCVCVCVCVYSELAALALCVALRRSSVANCKQYSYNQPPSASCTYPRTAYFAPRKSFHSFSPSSCPHLSSWPWRSYSTVRFIMSNHLT